MLIVEQDVVAPFFIEQGVFRIKRDLGVDNNWKRLKFYVNQLQGVLSDSSAFGGNRNNRFSDEPYFVRCKRHSFGRSHSRFLHPIDKVSRGFSAGQYVDYAGKFSRPGNVDALYPCM